ncbi:hypothetical protein SRB17_80120 [Streptomyces sp. RB17]|nr:hypothetical protein [Streptomyces sp. RB17]
MKTFVHRGQITKVVFGSGTRSRIPEEADALGCGRVLVLCTPDQADQAAQTGELLGAAAAGTFAEAAPHTPVEVTGKAVAYARSVGADAVLAIGGGSTVGLGKAIAARTGLPTGLRDRVKIGVSGKVATGADIVKRLVQGADFTNAARAMMFAIGCIQAQSCHTNACPVGVATRDPRRARALNVDDKSGRVHRFHSATVKSAQQIIASLGVREPADLRPYMLRRRVDPVTVLSYAELYDWLVPGQLLIDLPETWAADRKAADPDRFDA